MLKRAFNILNRNWLTAVPTVIIMAVVLTLFYALATANEQAKNAIAEIEGKFSVVFYLKDDADPFEVGNMIAALEARKDITPPVKYISKNDAFERIARELALGEESRETYLSALPASMEITLKSASSAQDIESYAMSAWGNLIKETRPLSDNLQKFIADVRAKAQTVFWLFVVLFLVGGSALFASAIHLAVIGRKHEIAQLHADGAHESRITATYIEEAIIMAICAIILHTILIAALPIELPSIQKTLNILLIEAAATLILAAISSWLTVKLLIMRLAPRRPA